MDEKRNYCAITNELNCKCMIEREKVAELKVDLKSALRKLFTDHAVYTALVMKSTVDGGKDTNVLLNRLLSNQKDIGDQLTPIIGVVNGDKITYVLTEHIKRAGDVITAAVKKDPTLDNKIQLLFENSDIVAETLSSLNPELLPFEDVAAMFQEHNQFVIDMTLSRINKEFYKEVKLYDAYYNEILLLSDTLYNAL